METISAATLQKKKINKGKLKKAIKNVLCRPDPVFWPEVTDDQKLAVENILSKYKVNMPEFKKPLWKDLKAIPKTLRPKPPKIDKVEGLLFGITECSQTIQSGQCSGVILEATVNPRTLVQPIIESCIDATIPVICIEGLRKATKLYYGIATTCLGVKRDGLQEISKIIQQFGSKQLPQKKETKIIEDVEMSDGQSSSPMDTHNPNEFEYLYRANKKTRVFVPSSEEIIHKLDKKFVGQDFIEFSDKPSQQSKKSFKNMIVKRISNNPNRIKVK